jgi:CRP-like cAMP-binding protein
MVPAAWLAHAVAMDPERLKHLDGFETLPSSLLAEAARQARLLRLPAGRWLVRAGRRLPGRLYLLSGRLRLKGRGGSWQVSAASEAARRPVYPGPVEVFTLQSSELAAVPHAVLDGLTETAPGPLPGLPRLREDDSWQHRFLGSPLMQKLPPAAWQRVLRAMARHRFEPRDVVVRAGEPAACCYVLSGGHAEILAPGGERVASLRPGALFGEDALLSGGYRNATVRFCSAGSAVSLPAACFEAWLVSAVTPPLSDLAGRRLLSLDGRAPGRKIALARLRDGAAGLPGGHAYAVTGGAWRQRRLAAFLLAEQGLDVCPQGIGAAALSG